MFSGSGTTYGSGDGSITFNQPDFAGDFTRGYLSGTSKEVGKRQGEGLPEMSGGLLQIPGGLMPLTAGAFLPTNSESALTFANASTANVKTVYTMKASASSSIYGSSSHVTPRNHALNF